MTLAFTIYGNILIPLSEFQTTKEKGVGATLSWSFSNSPSVSEEFKGFLQKEYPDLLDVKGSLLIRQFDGVGDEQSVEECFVTLRAIYEFYEDDVV